MEKKGEKEKGGQKKRYSQTNKLGNTFRKYIYIIFIKLLTKFQAKNKWK